MLNTSSSVIENIKSNAYASPVLENDILWDKIVKIEYVGNLHVYDLSIEGTHNFVAEGIVAHNTYPQAENQDNPDIRESGNQDLETGESEDLGQNNPIPESPNPQIPISKLPNNSKDTSASPLDELGISAAESPEQVSESEAPQMSSSPITESEIPVSSQDTTGQMAVAGLLYQDEVKNYAELIACYQRIKRDFFDKHKDKINLSAGFLPILHNGQKMGRVWFDENRDITGISFSPSMYPPDYAYSSYKENARKTRIQLIEQLSDEPLIALFLLNQIAWLRGGFAYIPHYQNADVKFNFDVFEGESIGKGETRGIFHHDYGILIGLNQRMQDLGIHDTSEFCHEFHHFVSYDNGDSEDGILRNVEGKLNYYHPFRSSLNQFFRDLKSPIQSDVFDYVQKFFDIYRDLKNSAQNDKSQISERSLRFKTIEKYIEMCAVEHSTEGYPITSEWAPIETQLGLNDVLRIGLSTTQWIGDLMKDYAQKNNYHYDSFARMYRLNPTEWIAQKAQYYLTLDRPELMDVYKSFGMEDQFLSEEDLDYFRERYGEISYWHYQRMRLEAGLTADSNLNTIEQNIRGLNSDGIAYLVPTIDMMVEHISSDRIKTNLIHLLKQVNVTQPNSTYLPADRQGAVEQVTQTPKSAASPMKDVSRFDNIKDLPLQYFDDIGMARKLSGKLVVSRENLTKDDIFKAIALLKNEATELDETAKAIKDFMESREYDTQQGKDKFLSALEWNLENIGLPQAEAFDKAVELVNHLEKAEKTSGNIITALRGIAPAILTEAVTLMLLRLYLVNSENERDVDNAEEIMIVLEAFRYYCVQGRIKDDFIVNLSEKAFLEAEKIIKRIWQEKYKTLFGQDSIKIIERADHIYRDNLGNLRLKRFNEKLYNMLKEGNKLKVPQKILDWEIPEAYEEFIIQRDQKRKDLTTAAREVINEFKQGIVGVMIGGGWAKGTFTPESDIDLLVIYENKESINPRQAVRFAGQLEEALKKKDVISEESDIERFYLDEKITFKDGLDLKEEFWSDGLLYTFDPAIVIAKDEDSEGKIRDSLNSPELLYGKFSSSMKESNMAKQAPENYSPVKDNIGEMTVKPGGIDLSKIEITLKDEKFTSSLNPADLKILRAGRALSQGWDSLSLLYVHEVAAMLEDNIVSDIQNKLILQEILNQLNNKNFLDPQAIQFFGTNFSGLRKEESIAAAG